MLIHIIHNKTMFSLIRSSNSKLIFLTAIEMTFVKIITLNGKNYIKAIFILIDFNY